MTLTRLGSMLHISLWRFRIRIWIVRPRRRRIPMRHGYPIQPSLPL